MAIGPTRPIIIKVVINNFPIMLKLEVIPADNPTVPNAEVASKSIFIKLKFSVIVRIRVITNVEVSATNICAFDLSTLKRLIVRLKIETAFLPLSEAIEESILAANDVVLIPPPVLPGDAPINIRIIITNKLALDIIVISIVLKPTVVDAEIDWKNAFSIF